MLCSSASDAVAKSNSERVLTPAELADYISFARQTTTPELTDAAADKLVQGAPGPLSLPHYFSISRLEFKLNIWRFLFLCSPVFLNFIITQLAQATWKCAAQALAAK